jgi:hypothetical protein
VAATYPGGYPHTKSAKYGRTANFIFKYVNKKKDIKVSPSGMKYRNTKSS